jgi:hypothetical protein
MYKLYCLTTSDRIVAAVDLGCHSDAEAADLMREHICTRAAPKHEVWAMGRKLDVPAQG